MPREAQSKQMIGFSIGSSTAPDYIIPSTQYAHDPSPLFDSLIATLGSRDNHYKKTLVGFESIPVAFTIALDDKIVPVLLGAGMKPATTGTSPDFVNTLTPFDDNIDGNTLTFFFYDAQNGLIKQEGKLLNTATITPESSQINVEFEFLGGTQEVLTGTDKSTAENNFILTEDTIGYIFLPGQLRVSHADTLDTLDYNSPITPGFGLNFGISNSVQEINKTLSGAGELLTPTPHYGQFIASFEFTHDVENNVLYDKYISGQGQAFGFRVRRDDDNLFEFKFETVAYQCQQSEKVADSDDPVAQTITLERGLNSVTNSSLEIIFKGSTDLASLF